MCRFTLFLHKMNRLSAEALNINGSSVHSGVMKETWKSFQFVFRSNCLNLLSLSVINGFEIN